MSDPRAAGDAGIWPRGSKGWRERNGPAIEKTPDQTGFGTQLATMSAAGQLGGSIAFAWEAEGARITLTVARERLLE